MIHCDLHIRKNILLSMTYANINQFVSICQVLFIVHWHMIEKFKNSLYIIHAGDTIDLGFTYITERIMCTF